MKSYHFIAWRELLAQKVTSSLILTAVILSTITTTVAGQSIGILRAMRQQQAITINGERYAAFRQMSEEQLSELKSDSRLSYIGPYISIGTVDMNDQMTLGLTEYADSSLDAYPAVSQIQEGRLPEKAMEIALPEDALKYLGFTGGTGDTISLNISKNMRHDIVPEIDYTADFILTGITKSNYIGYIYGGLIFGIVGNGTASQLLPEDYLYHDVDFCTADKRTFQDTVNDLAEKLQIQDLDIFYNQIYLQACGIKYDGNGNAESNGSGFSYMAAAGVMAGALILFMAGLVIYHIFKITISKHMKEYGILRAIGSEKGQLYHIVFFRILILCAVGIPVGVILGLLSVRKILTAAVGFLSPQIFMVQSSSELQELILKNSSGKPLLLVLSAAGTLLFALAATVPAARYAAGTAPIAVMSGRKVKIKRRHRKTGKIRNFEAYYARLNLKRNRSRTVVTVLTLAVSISVFIALHSSITLLDVMDGNERNYNGDYSIVNENTGFSPDDLKKLTRNRAVDSVAAIQFSIYESEASEEVQNIELGFELHPPEVFQVAGLNEVYWDYFATSDYFVGREISDKDLSLLKSGKACIVKNPPQLSVENKELERTTFEPGEKISVAGRDIPILATLEGYDCISVGNDGYTHGVQVIVSDSLYPELTGNNVYSEMCPALKENADRDWFKGSIEEICQTIPGTTYLSYEEAERQLRESFEQIRLLASGVVLFISLIGLLNIINTVYTNIHTRIVEIGMERAIGMNTGSLYKTFLWEGTFYGMEAVMIGSAIGYICTVFIEAASNGTIRLVPVPVIPIIEAAVVMIGACLAATCIPLRKIIKLSIVDSIDTIE